MADNQIEEVKSKTDIVSIIGERIELKKAGRNYKSTCPFHGEKTPSFMVSPELQIFKCFGCGEAGDVFAFLEKYEGMEFSEALKYLAERAGIKLKNLQFGASTERERIIEINSHALRFYNYLLTTHPMGKPALKYLTEERGLKKETIDEFKLGYSPENPLLIKKFLVDKKKFLPSELEKAGIGSFGGGRMYDRLGGRVIFPLFDHRGNPIGFAGRLLPWDKREAGKYINSPDSPAYHKSSVLYALNITRPFIKKKKVAIVVEGELDLISSYQSGIRNVVAIKGSALTEDQVRLLSRFAPKFILALDSDFAGDAAARRGITVASNIGVEVKVAKLTGYKDPDEAARKNLESYKNDLVNAVGVWDFLIDSVFARFSSGSGADKAKISREIIPILAEIDDNIVQAHYAGIVAERLAVPQEAVSEQISKVDKDQVKSTASQSQEQPIEALVPEVQTRRGLLESRLLGLAFRSDPKILMGSSMRSLINAPLSVRLLGEYEDFLSKNKTFDISAFGKKLPKELFDGFSQMVLTSDDDLVDKPDELQRELDLIQKELKILDIKDNLKLLATQMRELEAKGEKEKLLTAQNKFNKLAKMLSSLGQNAESGVIFSV